MKKSVYTASLVLSLFAAIPIQQVVAASSNADDCQQVMRPVTTGGAVREQLEAAIKCRRQAVTKSQATSQQPVTESKGMKMDNKTMPGIKMDGDTMPNMMPDNMRNR